MNYMSRCVVGLMIASNFGGCSAQRRALRASASDQPAIEVAPSSATWCAPGTLSGTIRLRDGATFLPDTVIWVKARYFNGDPVVIGQDFVEVREWPVRFKLPIPVSTGRGMRPLGIRGSARAELDGRVVLVTEETWCEWDSHWQSVRVVDLLLVPAVE
jgi:hypothetical protein